MILCQLFTTSWEHQKSVAEDPKTGRVGSSLILYYVTRCRHNVSSDIPTRRLLAWLQLRLDNIIVVANELPDHTANAVSRCLRCRSFDHFLCAITDASKYICLRYHPICQDGPLILMPDCCPYRAHRCSRSSELEKKRQSKENVDAHFISAPPSIAIDNTPSYVILIKISSFRCWIELSHSVFAFVSPLLHFVCLIRCARISPSDVALWSVLYHVTDLSKASFRKIRNLCAYKPNPYLILLYHP